MLTIPETIQALLRADSVRKNFRVQFPNGEHADLTNSDIVAGSVHFTESVCSREAFRFGLAESSVIKFETVGVGQIRGATIKCFCEIDTSSLTSAQITAIRNDPGDGSIVLASASDIGYGFYRIPYGVFVVDTCPRNHEAISHRQVTAYSPAYYNVPNLMEQAKLQCPIPHSGWTYQPLIAPLVLAQLAYQSDDPIIAAGWTGTDWSMTMAGGNINGIKVRVTNADGHTLDIYVSYIYKWMPTDTSDGQIFSLWYTKSVYRDFLTRVDNYLSSLNVQYTTATVAGSVTVPLPDVQTLRYLISRQVQVYDGVTYTGQTGSSAYDAVTPYVAFYERQNGDSSIYNTTSKILMLDIESGSPGRLVYYPYGITSDPEVSASGRSWAYVYMPDKVIITVDDITAGTSTTSGFISKPADTDWGIKYYTPPADYPLAGVTVKYEANGDERNISSFSGQVDFARLINDYLELCGWVSSPARDGDARLIHLSDATALPYAPSDYSEYWFDEDSGTRIGAVRYTAMVGDERTVADYQFGNGEGIYDMSANSIFERIGYSPAQVNAFLQAYFVPYVQNLVLNGIEMEARGLPQLEAGDYITVSDGSTSVGAYAVRRELRGEQVLFDSLESAGQADGTSGSPSAIYTAAGGSAEIATKPSVQNILLPLSWTDSGNGYHTCTPVITWTPTAASKVSLQPTQAQIQQLQADGVTALYVQNSSGVLTAYAVGNAPTTMMGIQCTVEETDSITGAIGDTVGVDAGSVETIDGWTVRKFPDGYAEVFTNKAITFNNSTSFGSIYSGTTEVQFPSGVFVTNPIVNVTCSSWTNAWGSARTIRTTSFFLINHDRYSGSQERYYCIRAIGRWK